MQCAKRGPLYCRRSRHNSRSSADVDRMGRWRDYSALRASPLRGRRRQSLRRSTRPDGRISDSGLRRSPFGRRVRVVQNRLRRFCRTLDGLLTPRKALKNQQLTDSQRIAFPYIPLISPSLAVVLSVEAPFLVPTLSLAHRWSPLQSLPWLDSTHLSRSDCCGA